MADRRDGDDDLRFPASALRRALLKVGVPRLMADHAAALLSALLPRRRKKRDDR